jgi:ligand-binding sensor domain-containing protein
MKKIIFCLFFFFTGSVAMAIKPSEWTILQKNYTYNNGKVQRALLTGDLKILDIAVASGKLWILTNKDLYVLRERGDELFLDHPLATKEIRYQTAETPPRLYTGYQQKGLVLQTGEKYWTSNDYQQWAVNPLQPDGCSFDFSVEGKFLLRTAEMLILPDGSYCASGLFGRRSSMIEESSTMPGVMLYTPGSGDDPKVYLLSSEQAQAARQRDMFRFTDLHRAKNNTLWMRGNQNGRGLWGLLRNELRLIANNVMDIASDDNGEIYVATNNALYKIDNENQLVKFLDMGATYMACDKKGFLWFVPAQQPGSEAKPDMLIKYNLKTDTYFKLFPENYPVSGKIRKIVVDNNNVKYILADNKDGIYIIDDAPLKDENWNIIVAGDGVEVLNENYWEALFKGKDGNYVSLVQDKKLGLMFFQNNQWTPVKTYDKPRGFYNIKDIVEQNEKIYLVTSYGFYRLENDRFEQMADFDKKQFSNRISAVIKDDENNMWLGSNKGIAKFDGMNYTYFNKKNTPELAEESILSICTDRDKKIFFGTANGLAVQDNGNWTFYDKKSGLDSKKIAAVASDSKGQTFIAAVSLLGVTDVISIYEEGRLRNEPLPKKILIEKMMVDKYDNLWIQARTLLVCRKAGGEYISYDFKNSPIPKDLVIKNIFLFEDEIRVIIDEDVFDKSDGLPDHSRPMPLLGMDVTKFQLNTFISTRQVLIYNIK